MSSFAPSPVASKDAEDPKKIEPSTPTAGTPARPEHGGPKGPEPTRYGDWERNGRCYDF